MSKSFFDIRGRDALYAIPPDTDPVAWDDYISDQHSAEEFNNTPAAPLQIDFELNGSCNMACPFCIHGSGDGRIHAELNFETYAKLIDEAAKIGTKSIKLNYINEPLLRRDLEKAIAYAKSQGILNVYFVTNGSLLFPARRQSLLASGVTKIFVSIDAATSKTYDKQRRNGAFQTIVENVKALVEERNALGQRFPVVRVSFLKNQLNIHEADQFYEYWKDIVDVVTFQTMNEIPGKTTGLTLEETTEPLPCSFPNKQLVVDSEGDILPCCKLYGKSLALGNISSMSLEEAWSSDKMVALRESHNSGTWQDNPVCRKCLLNQ